MGRYRVTIRQQQKLQICDIDKVLLCSITPLTQDALYQGVHVRIAEA